jgi:hypothetical protein
MTDHRTLREQVAELVDRLELSDCADARHCLCVTIAIKRLREALLAAPAPSPFPEIRETIRGQEMVWDYDDLRWKPARDATAVAPPATPHKTAWGTTVSNEANEAAEPPAPTGSARDDEPSGR